MKYTFTLLTCILLLFSCKPYKRHLTSSYESKSTRHKTIAILPVSMSEKDWPSDIFEEDKSILLLEENLSLQRTIHNHIARRTGSGKNDIKIRVKSVQNINKILSDHLINYSNIEDIPESKLKDILDVDAVVRTLVSTKRLLIDDESDKVRHVIEAVATNLPLGSLGRQVVNTQIEDIITYSEIIDLNSAEPIWSLRKTHQVNLTEKSSQLVDRIGRDIGHKFPYRE